MDRRQVLAGLAGAVGGVVTSAGQSPAEEPKPVASETLNLGAKVGIVCDHTMAEEGRALRGMLEAFRLDVDLHRLTQRWQADEFFAKRAANYKHLILCCHGSGPPRQRIKLQVIDPKKDNPEYGDMGEYALTPATVPDQLVGFRGVFVSMACESGRPEFGAAFLKAGCKAYLGPGDYNDMSSGLVFVTAFFYFLGFVWRLPDPHLWTVAAAHEAARKIDPLAKFGTKIWNLYEQK